MSMSKIAMSYYAKELLRTGVTRLDLWITYRNDQPHGYSYSQFCYILQRLDIEHQSDHGSLTP